MRDDFQVPNIGQATDTYDKNFFSRMARNIEMTFMTLRAKGQGIFSDLHADTLDVADTLTTKDITASGNLSVTGNATVTGTSSLTGAVTTTGSLAVGTTLNVTGASTLHGTSVSSLSDSGNATVGGTLGVTGATALASDLNFNGIFTRNSLPQWETIDAGYSTAIDKRFLNLGAYRRLRLHMHASPTVADQCFMRYSTDNGATFPVGSTEYYNNLLFNVEGTATPSGVASQLSYWDVSFANSVAVNVYGIELNLEFSNFNQAVQTKAFGFVDCYNGTSVFKGPCSFRTASTVVSNGLIFGSNTGKTLNMYYHLEGIRG